MTFSDWGAFGGWDPVGRPSYRDWFPTVSGARRLTGRQLKGENLVTRRRSRKRYTQDFSNRGYKKGQRAYVSHQHKFGLMYGEEQKHKLFAFGTQSATTSGLPTIFGGSLSGIAQGTGEDERIGNYVTLKTLTFRGKYITSLPTTGTTYLTVWFVIDRQNNNQSVPTTSPFKTPTGTSTIMETLAFPDLSKSSRFRVFKYKLPVLVSTNHWDGTVAVNQGSTRQFNIVVPVKNLIVEYNATGDTGTSIVSNAIYLYVAQAGDTAVDKGALLNDTEAELTWVG